MDKKKGNVKLLSIILFVIAAFGFLSLYFIENNLKKINDDIDYLTNRRDLLEKKLSDMEKNKSDAVNSFRLNRIFSAIKKHDPLSTSVPGSKMYSLYEQEKRDIIRTMVLQFSKKNSNYELVSEKAKKILGSMNSEHKFNQIFGEWHGKAIMKINDHQHKIFQKDAKKNKINSFKGLIFIVSLVLNSLSVILTNHTSMIDDENLNNQLLKEVRRLLPRVNLLIKKRIADD